jgi:hypothetical protein
MSDTDSTSTDSISTDSTFTDSTDSSDSSDSSDATDSTKIKKRTTEKNRKTFKQICKRYDLYGILNDISKNTVISGCDDYKNSCNIICDKCPEDNNIYACCKCHNSIKEIGHELSHNDIKMIQCIKCKHKQEFKNKCDKCDLKFASYCCYECKLMNNIKDREIYHCNKCNACRIGKQSDYEHCDKCKLCVQKQNIKIHGCIQGMMDADRLCPICQDGIRTQLSLIMKCGHTIHKDCYDLLVKNTYKCPECSQTIKDTTELFKNMAQEIRETTLHSELHRMVKIRCNDCGNENMAQYHYIGTMCPNKKCKSFNTYQI